jgi:hypothetical protein
LTAELPASTLGWAPGRIHSMMTELAELVAVLGTIGAWVMAIVTVAMALSH